MLDRHLQPLLQPPLARGAAALGGRGITANQVTLAGFCVGLLALPLLATGHSLLGLAAIALNRTLDGLDGALARLRGPTDLGGYLDIVCDFLFYAAVVFGFALARPENAVAAAFLLFAFIGTGASFLAFAAIAARRGITESAALPKGLYYLGGLMEGTETILAFVLFCLFPEAFATLAYIFGALCWITTATRLLAAWRSFG